MAPTQTVSRDDAVLVLIDLQCALADVMLRRDPVVATASLLARVANALGMPVVVTRQYPRGLGETVPEIIEAAGPHEPVDKVSFSCLDEPAFRSRLESLGRRQIVLAGMETHICVVQTALALIDQGFAVFVAADATCSRRDRDHDLALERLRASGAVVVTAESVIYEALGRAGTPEFKAVLEFVKAQPAG